MNKRKGILTNVLILCGVFALLIFTQSCGTVSGFGQDIKDVSGWGKEKLQNSDEEEVINYEEEVI
jgi:predicted small secreted protein|tara:strand:+ start:4499 stop:4693 length:195 start_codon:yes stop_codon:yes gene_type:complete